MATTFDMVIDYEDGTQEEIRADARDCRAWELTHKGIGTPKALEECPFVFFSWIALHALKRTGRTELALDAWQDVAVSVDAADPEEADPGQPVALTGTSSN